MNAKPLCTIVALASVISACDPSHEEVVAAAAAGDVETVQRGIAAGSGPHLDEALRAAVENGHVPAVRALLESGISAGHLMSSAAAEHDRDSSREPLTPSVAVAGALLDHGAPGNVYLLPHAIRTQTVELARAVLDHPRVMAQLAGPNGRAWMHAAAADGGTVTVVHTGNRVMVRLLLARGLDQGVVMLEAARQGNPEIVIDAVEAGGDGEVAMEHALSEETQNRAAIVRALLERGVRRPRALTVAALRGDVETVRVLLEYGSTDYDSAVMNARNGGHDEVVAILEAARAATASP